MERLESLSVNELIPDNILLVTGASKCCRGSFIEEVQTHNLLARETTASIHINREVEIHCKVACGKLIILGSLTHVDTVGLVLYRVDRPADTVRIKAANPIIVG